MIARASDSSCRSPQLAHSRYQSLTDFPDSHYPFTATSDGDCSYHERYYDLVLELRGDVLDACW